MSKIIFGDRIDQKSCFKRDSKKKNKNIQKYPKNNFSDKIDQKS